MSACPGGSPDFGEADTRFGLSGFCVRVLVFLGAGGPGLRGSWGWRKAVRASPSPGRVLGFPRPRSPASPGAGEAGVGPARWPRSPVDVGPEVRAQHVHRLDAAAVQQPDGPLAQHPPCSARPVRVLARLGPPGAPAAGEPAQQLAPTDVPRALIRPRVGGAWAGRPACSSQWVEGPSVKLITPSPLPGPRCGQVEDDFLLFSWFIDSAHFQWAPSCRAPGRRTSASPRRPQPCWVHNANVELP